MCIDICFQYQIFFTLKWKQEHFLSNFYCGNAQFLDDETHFFFLFWFLIFWVLRWVSLAKIWLGWDLDPDGINTVTLPIKLVGTLADHDITFLSKWDELYSIHIEFEANMDSRKKYPK